MGTACVRGDAVAALRALGVAAGPVKDTSQVMNDAQVRERGMVQVLDVPAAGPIVVTGSPIHLSATPIQLRPAPTWEPTPKRFWAKSAWPRIAYRNSHHPASSSSAGRPAVILETLLRISDRRRAGVGGAHYHRSRPCLLCYFTGNWEGLHADEEAARKTRFGTRIGSGRMLFALVSGLLRPAPDIEIAAYGVDRIGTWLRSVWATRFGTAPL